jgi:hypothetical protein
MPSGWTPSPYDGRDIQYSPYDGVAAVPLRAALRHPFAVRNQADVPCCVSIVVATCMEALDAQRGRTIELSPLYHYYIARSNPNELNVLDARTALQAASTIGICRRELHHPPFTAEGAATSPSDAARADGERQRLAGYDVSSMRMQYSIVGGIAGSRVEGCKAAIARGVPVMLAFWVTSAYRALSALKPVHGPPPRERSDDGHAVTLLGYDDARGSFLVKDSRGASFGKNGHWQMPYSVVESPLVHEAWVLERIQYDA